MLRSRSMAAPAPTHFYCLRCGVVVSITLEAAAEVAKHVGHPCKYTRVVA